MAQEKIKDKLLAALDCCLSDLTAECLVDILIDAYQATRQESARLQGANGHEREMLRAEEERMRIEQQRLRNDPLYGAAGHYFFAGDNQVFRIDIAGHDIRLSTRRGAVDHPTRQITLAEFAAWDEP